MNTGNSISIDRVIGEISESLGDLGAARGAEPPVLALPRPPDPAEVDTLTNRDLARWIDHTLLRPDATENEIRRLCAEALEYGFAAVCVNPSRLELCAELLKGGPVRIAVVVGFPLGATTPEQKAFEARRCAARGADELDMVLNLGLLKDKVHRAVLDDIRGVVEAAPEAAVKVILENCCLTLEEKIAGCLLARAAGAAFVKTSTGFGVGGATADDVALMRRAVGPAMGVKAAGGIRTAQQAREMLRAGASRLGASASVGIVTAS